MKKILTSIFAIAMVVVMALFVACDESSSSSPYSGNYKEVDAQTLYNSTREVKNNWIITEPLDGERAGITLKMTNSTIMDSAVYKMNNDISVDGKMVNYTNEAGEIQTIANFKYIEKYSYEVNGEKSSSSTTTYLYADGSNFYKRTITDDGINESNGYTISITEEEFIETIAGYAGMASESQTIIPDEESAFIALIEDLCDRKGYRFSIADSKGLKVKLDVKDKEKYEQNDTGISSPATLDLQKMEMYFIFGEEGYMDATKMVMDMNSFAADVEMKISLSIDMRSYDGNVSIPNDLGKPVE